LDEAVEVMFAGGEEKERRRGGEEERRSFGSIYRGLVLAEGRNSFVAA